MSNAIMKKPDLQIDVKGSGNTVNGFVDKLIIINQGASPSRQTVNNDFCNIFVLKEKSFKGGCFSILKKRIYIDDKATDISEYPSLFVTANDEYTRCSDAEQQFHYGFVREVEDEHDSVKIYYELRSTQKLYQHDLNSVAKDLGITPIKGKDILGETGWTSYPINIVKALNDAGIDMTVY